MNEELGLAQQSMQQAPVQGEQDITSTIIEALVSGISLMELIDGGITIEQIDSAIKVLVSSIQQPAV